MNHRNTVVAWLLFLCAANAFSAAPSGIYGEIDTHRFTKPKLINSKPVVIDAADRARKRKPVYLHVVPGDEWHWFNKCHAYDACAQSVYFVTEGWFMNVYLPAIGSRDGREQHYRIDSARQRATERDKHDVHGDD